MISRGLNSSLTRTFTSSTRVSSLSSFFDTPSGWSWLPATHGPPWLASQLRQKSFEDLHTLWWVCMREMNKLYSQKHESEVFRVAFPHQKPLRNAHIKQVLGERKMAYEKALEIQARETERIRLVSLLPETSLDKETPREVIETLLRTVPVPALGIVAGAVGLGIRPYRDGFLPVSNYRTKKWQKESTNAQKEHENNYFIL